MYHTWHNDIYWKKKKRCKNHIPPATIKKGDEQYIQDPVANL